IAAYPLANDPYVQRMADEAMRRFRRAEQVGEATEARVKPFLEKVLKEDRGFLDSDTKSDYLAAMIAQCARHRAAH
ncbi:MAG: hypothetical protein AAB427_16635, partial [Chloroflexota bacterium]